MQQWPLNFHYNNHDITETHCQRSHARCVETEAIKSPTRVNCRYCFHLSIGVSIVVVDRRGMEILSSAWPLRRGLFGYWNGANGDTVIRRQELRTIYGFPEAIKSAVKQ